MPTVSGNVQIPNANAPFAVALVMRDSTGAYQVIPSDTAGNTFNTLGTLLAGERNAGSATGSYLATQNDWTITDFNPHTATTGVTITAGTAGNTEVLISNAPVSLGYIITAADTVAGSILLRNTTATGNSVSPIVLGTLLNTTTVYPFGGAKFTSGLTIVGTLAGVSCQVYWKAT